MSNWRPGDPERRKVPHDLAGRLDMIEQKTEMRHTENQNALSNLSKAVVQVHEAIHGNGKPGLTFRMFRIELIIGVMLFLLGAMTTAIINRWFGS